MPRPKLDREQARLRILAKADELFRQYGFGKTTVADIAKELQMSSANIYKFFPSKNAIVQACADTNVEKLKALISKIRASRLPPPQQLEKIVLGIHRFHQDLLRNERQIFRIILTAREEKWRCFNEFETFINTTLQQLLQDGIQSGDFRKTSVVKTARSLGDCLTVALHPHLRHDHSPSENQTRVRAQLELLQHALK